MYRKNSLANRSNLFNPKQVVDDIEDLTICQPGFLTVAIPDIPLMNLPKRFHESQPFVGNLLGGYVLDHLAIVP